MSAEDVCVADRRTKRLCDGKYKSVGVVIIKYSNVITTGQLTEGKNSVCLCVMALRSDAALLRTYQPISPAMLRCCREFQEALHTA